MTKQCTPCITIRNILTILKNNAILFYKNTKNDIRSYSTVNAAVCELSKPVAPRTLQGEMAKVRKIREEAMKNHITTTEEFYEDLRKDLKFQFNEEDRVKIEDAFSKALDDLQKNTSRNQLMQEYSEGLHPNGSVK